MLLPPFFPLFFAWSASSKANYRRQTKGAIKLHLILDPDEYPPTLASSSKGDSPVSKSLKDSNLILALSLSMTD
jgi:hypothetical protein